MKQLIFAALMLVSASSFANSNAKSIVCVIKISGDGKHISAAQVPAKVLSAFYQMYPTAMNVQWELEKEHGASVYQAEFTVKGSRKKAVYAVNGTVAGAGGGSDDGPNHQ